MPEEISKFVEALTTLQNFLRGYAGAGHAAISLHEDGAVIVAHCSPDANGRGKGEIKSSRFGAVEPAARFMYDNDVVSTYGE